MTLTIRDIAREAGVSTATVSRALRNLPNVDPATAERVRRVAERMDYVVSPAASRLASGRAGAIGVITPFVARWYFSRVISAIEGVLADSDLDLLLVRVGDPAEPHRIPPVRRLRKRVDGFLVLALDDQSHEVRDLFELGLPVSLIGSEHAGVASVNIDDVAGAEMMTQHLINQGHRRIGIIGGRPLPSPFAPDRDRYVGFERALSKAGIAMDPAREAFGWFTVDGGEQAMNQLLARPEPPTAVFAISDEMAFGALRSLRAHGLRVGEDIALAGFDGHEMSELLDLSTIVQPIDEIGCTAAQGLLDQIDGAQLAGQENQVLPVKLVVRASTMVRRTP